ncbi:MAG: coproporphyrinogen III oxidase family protein [Desulfomonile sp.]
MIIENLLTSYLKRKNAQILNFTDLDSVVPPTPKSGTSYLLYVHIPFCEELCPYCSFNRFRLDRDLARTYFKCLDQEIRFYADLGFNFTSVYVGGGTPTVMPQELAELLDDLKKLFGVNQVSLETNPNHLTEEIVGVLKDGGVNRLSVGVQSFDDSLLKQMERYQKYGSGQQIQDKLSQLMGRFETLNVDMIFNFPSQKLSMLERDVAIIKEIKADQVTFYPLMVSDMTRKQLAERFGPISYRKEKFFYGRIVSMLQPKYGFGTAWCFSRRTSTIDEYIVDYDEYVGAGSGSFGYVGGSCYANTFSVGQYIDSVEKGKFPLLAKKDFTMTEQIHYDFMMKLFGAYLEVSKAEEKFDGRFMKTLWKEIPFLRLSGALVQDNGFLRLTQKGRYLWVIMMREFFTGVNNFRDICRTRVKGLTDCF